MRGERTKRIAERLSLAGPMTRHPRAERRYRSHRQKSKTKNAACSFCDIAMNGGPQYVGESEHCPIITNVFGYDIWDGCGVTEHMMIIPKRHVASLDGLTSDEKLDYITLAAKYEARGYSLYARSPGNVTKSAIHHHMHLIKTDNTRKKWMIYIRKPHIRLAR